MYKNQSDFYLENARNNAWYGFFLPLKQLGLKHGFSTRLGGKSTGEVGSLNISFCVGDDEKNVKENRKIFCDAVGVDVGRLITAKQVHGTTIAVAKKVMAGMGADEQKTAIDSADAIITTEKGLPLMLGFADCVPLIIYVPHKNIVAVVHAGWRGTIGRIAAKTVKQICNEYEVAPREIFVAIGPSIGSCCYEVSEDLAREFSMEFGSEQMIVKEIISKKNIKKENNSVWILDLWRANVVQLLDVGLSEKNIFISNVCTNCNKDIFFSHRASKGNAGRMGMIVSL